MCAAYPLRGGVVGWRYAEGEAWHWELPQSGHHGHVIAFPPRPDRARRAAPAGSCANMWRITAVAIALALGVACASATPAEPVEAHMAIEDRVALALRSTRGSVGSRLVPYALALASSGWSARFALALLGCRFMLVASLFAHNFVKGSGGGSWLLLLPVLI